MSMTDPNNPTDQMGALRAGGPDVVSEEMVLSAVGPNYRIVQVLCHPPMVATSSVLLLPAASVRTQALTETVRPLRLQGPHGTEDVTQVIKTQTLTDAEVAKTIDTTHKLTDAEVDKTVDRTHEVTNAVVDQNIDRTRELTDSEVDKTVNKTHELTDSEVDKTVNKTHNITDSEVDKTVNKTPKLADSEVDKTVDGTQELTGAEVDIITVDGTQNSTEKRRSDMITRFGGKRPRKNTCTRPVKNNIAKFPALKDYLPASCNETSYEYHVCHYQAISETGDHVNFRATLRMTLSTEDEIKLWLKSHTVTWRVERSYKPKGDRVLFKVEYRCQHNTRPPNSANSKTRKNTNCPAKMAVTLLRTRTERSRGRPSVSSDPHVPHFPMTASLCSEHNHDINGQEALRYRDVGDKAREKLLKLFEAGHNPSSALKVLKIDLQVEHGENYAVAAANKELCPSLEFCYRLRYKVLGKMRTHRPASGLPGGQKKRRRKKKMCPDVLQCVAEEELTDYLIQQGQGSQQNLGTNQEEWEDESAADFLCLPGSDHEEDAEDLVENMMRDISSLRKNPISSQAIAAMAKQFHHLKSNPQRLLSAIQCFGKDQASSKRTAVAVRPATAQPGGLSPCQPTANPRPVAKVSSKKRQSAGRQQTHKRQRMMDYHI